MAKDFTKQHIVPKRYLDRFGVKGEKEVIIGTRLLRNGKPTFFSASTNNVGYIKNYYDVTDKNDPKYWEHFYSEKIETHCGTDMENIIAKATLSLNYATILSESDKEAMSKVIIAQSMRIPESFNYVTKRIYPRISTQVKDEIFSILPQFMLDKYGAEINAIELTEQYLKEVLLNHSFGSENFKRYCRILQNAIWVVFVNSKRNILPFITSDNPVLIQGIGSKETGLFYNGLANPNTCIFYPLSPTVAVGIYSRYGLLGYVDVYDGKKVIIDDFKFICNKNVKIMAQAFNHSFFPQPLFDIIDKKLL